MNLFLWTTIVIYSVALLGKLVWLCKGEIPARTPKYEAIDVVLYVVLIVWAARLID